jgi:hypothetical protein
MAIVINGSGTVTGISVGGLPDGIVDAGTLATNSVDSAELVDGAVDDSHMAAMAASKLTGALPAISGASLTSLPAGLTLISTTDVSDGDSYVTLSNVFTSTYDKYVLEGMNFLPNTDNTAIRGNFETGGSTWNTSSVYDTQVFSLSNGTLAAWIDVVNGSYGAFAGYGNQGNVSNEQWHFTLELMQPSSTTDEKFWKGSQVGYDATGHLATILAAGSWRSTTAVTGVRFYYHNGGTFKTGKLKLYGVK